MDLPQPSTAKAVSSRDFKQRNRRRRKRRTRKSGGGGATQPPPPSPTVLSLMEMGFPRNAVERAVKAMPNASPSPVRLSKNVSGKIENVPCSEVLSSDFVAFSAPFEHLSVSLSPQVEGKKNSLLLSWTWPKRRQRRFIKGHFFKIQFSIYTKVIQYQ